MLARVTTIELPPETLGDEVLALRERVLREAQALPGFLGAYDLVDRATGRALAVTLWESEQALRTSERARKPRPGESQPHVEVFEARHYPRP